jgi:hypothetical protein
MLAEPLAVTLQVINTLNSLHVPYWIGGSLASALHGVARSTLDSDLVADLRQEQAADFAQALAPDFYVDVEMILDAIRRQSSFNIIHRGTFFKVDVFILKARPFEQTQLSRRVEQVISVEPERKAYVSTAEDTILAKLEWYRLGGEVSERQWRDVLGVMAVQGDRLDLVYLRRWATDLEVGALLERALGESGAGEGSEPPQ